MKKIIGVKKEGNEYLYLIKSKENTEWVPGDEILSYLKNKYFLKMWMKEWKNSKRFLKDKIKIIDLVERVHNGEYSEIEENENNESFFNFTESFFNGKIE